LSEDLKFSSLLNRSLNLNLLRAGGLFQPPARARIAIVKKAVIACITLLQGPGGEVERNIQVCSIDVVLAENLVGSQT
jgi:hypothetical protein